MVETFAPDTSYWSADLDGLVSNLAQATWYPDNQGAVRVLEMRNLFMVAFVRKVAEVDHQLSGEV